MRMQRLRCVAQNYAWGRRADEGSAVARLAAANAAQAGGAAQTSEGDERPFAELWMGAHPSGMSQVVGGGEQAQAPTEGVSLREWLEAHGAEACLGSAVARRWGGALPMLFKVLSVRTALSIQAHPDKALAERLHKERPQVYKDDNHKPEMALALEPFEALCGFVEAAQLRNALSAHPELRECVGEANAANADAAAGDAEKERAALVACFRAVMRADDALRQKCTRELNARLAGAGDLPPKEKLYLRLFEQYPDDIGTLAVFFLNYVTLQPGEALYLGANEPHAYLSGQCVECMATSDNVVRAGLTPKLRDTEVLCNMLTYRMGTPHVLRGEAVDGCKRLYAVPAPTDEFEVAAITVAPGEAYQLAANAGPQVVLCYSGTGTAAGAPLAGGACFFVPCGTEVPLSCDAGSSPLTLYAAAVSSRVFQQKRKGVRANVDRA